MKAILSNTISTISNSIPSTFLTLPDLPTSSSSSSSSLSPPSSAVPLLPPLPPLPLLPPLPSSPSPSASSKALHRQAQLDFTHLDDLRRSFPWLSCTPSNEFKCQSCLDEGKNHRRTFADPLNLPKTTTRATLSHHSTRYHRATVATVATVATIATATPIQPQQSVVTLVNTNTSSSSSSSSSASGPSLLSSFYSEWKYNHPPDGLIERKRNDEYFQPASLKYNGFGILSTKLKEANPQLLNLAKSIAKSKEKQYLEHPDAKQSKITGGFHQYEISPHQAKQYCILLKPLIQAWLQQDQSFMNKYMVEFKNMRLQTPKIIISPPNTGPQEPHMDSYNHKSFVVVLYLTEGSMSTFLSPHYNHEIPMEHLTHHLLPLEERHPAFQKKYDLHINEQEIELVNKPWDAEPSSFLHKVVEEGDIFIFHSDCVHFGPHHLLSHCRSAVFSVLQVGDFEDEFQVFESNFKSFVYGQGSQEHVKSLEKHLHFDQEQHYHIYSENQLKQEKESAMKETERKMKNLRREAEQSNNTNTIASIDNHPGGGGSRGETRYIHQSSEHSQEPSGEEEDSPAS